MGAARSGMFAKALLLLITGVAVHSEECRTLECKRLASRMLVQMSHEKTECDNFYKYACGGLYSDPFLREYDFNKDVQDRIKRVLETTNNSSLPIFQQFQTFYNSCILKTHKDEYEKQWAQEVISVLHESGSFDKKPNFTKLFLGLLKYDSPMVLDLTLDVDDTNSSRFVLKMSVPDRQSPFMLEDHRLHWCYLQNVVSNGSTIKLSELYSSFMKCKTDSMTESVKELTRGLNVLDKAGLYTMNSSYMANVQYQLETLYERNLNTTDPSELKQNVYKRKYEQMTVQRLKQRYRAVKWDVLLKGLLNQNVPGDTPVHVYSIDYFDNLFILNATKIRGDMNNALLASLLHKLYQDLVIHRQHGEEYCQRVTSMLMEDVAAAAYLSTFEPGELTEIATGVQNLFSEIKDTLRLELEHAEWLDPPSRSLLVSKLHDIHLELESAEKMFSNHSYLDQMMDGLSMDPEKYVQNSIKLLQRRRNLMYSVYSRNPEDPQSIWSNFLLPQSTSSVFVYSLNLIAMPFALAANPFCTLKLPKYVVMSRLGFELAYYLAHHFDGMGLHYINKKHEENPMITGKPAEYYGGMETCFFQQTGTIMSRRAADGRLVEVEPPLSKEAQLADNIATTLAYSLLQNMSLHEQPVLPFLNMTNDKAFFILLAQNSCSKQHLLSSAITLYEGKILPPFLRVSHIVTNSRGFKEAFGCPPAFSCEAFPYLTEESFWYYLPMSPGAA